MRQVVSAQASPRAGYGFCGCSTRRQNSNSASGPLSAMDTQPISFPTWKDALSRVPLAQSVRERHRREIIELLHFCKKRHRPVSVDLIKGYLQERPSPETREALRWFYREARRRPTTA